MKDIVIDVVIIVHRPEKQDTAEVGSIKNRPSTRSYVDGWERTFGKKQQDQTVN